jgi:site-specific recombinase XerD
MLSMRSPLSVPKTNALGPRYARRFKIAARRPSGSNGMRPTQNQALSALLFLYRHVLRLDPGAVDHVPHAHSPMRVTVVLSIDEVRAVLDQLIGIPRMIAALLYGAGLRLQESLELASKTSISTAIRS